MIQYQNKNKFTPIKEEGSADENNLLVLEN